MKRTKAFTALLAAGVYGIFSAGSFSAEAKAEEPGRYRPVIVGEWRVLFQPKIAGPRVNDHTVFQDRDGNWRFIGIAARRGLDLITPGLGHGVGSSLEEPLSELPVLFPDYPDRRPKWAPHVIEHEGVWHLFCGPGRIRHYTSPDGVNWTFHDYCIHPGWFAFRDTMALKLADDDWLMFCTDRGNAISVYRSSDLYKWTYAGRAFKAEKPAAAYPRWLDISATESPFVVAYGGAFYLSVCLTSALEPDSYDQTLVFRSENPLDFGVYAGDSERTTAELVARLPVHAAEFIRTPDGRWFITACGWKAYPGVEGMIPGAALIAELEWVKDE